MKNKNNILESKPEMMETSMYETQEIRKIRYYKSSSKRYVLNGKMLNGKRITCIPPFIHNNNFFTKFTKKAVKTKPVENQLEIKK